jgi:hypothetical protein
MAVIDADAHVVEWERTWEYMNEGERAFAPRVMVFKDPAQKLSGQRASEYWMIGGRVFSKDGNIGFDTARETREAADVKARLAHMDDLGVDIQVLYPSLFLRTPDIPASCGYGSVQELQPLARGYLESRQGSAEMGGDSAATLH